MGNGRRDTSTGSQTFQGVLRPDKVRKRQAKLTTRGTSNHFVDDGIMPLLNKGLKATVSLIDAHFGAKDTYPLATEHPNVEAGSKLSLTFSRWHAFDTNESDPTPETCYEVAMWETTKTKRREPDITSKIESFFFNSNDTKLWVSRHRFPSKLAL